MHLIGLLAVWLSAAALVWVSAFWAPPHIARFRELEMVLPGLTVAAVVIAQWVQVWAYALAVAVVIYSIAHLVLLRSFIGLLSGIAVATVFALPAALVFIGIILANNEIARALN